ncbi:MAG: guanosine monophosphate reductase [Candidatus Pacearchaeota archaeon]|nr:MAG: guanosine monophosphate reductase [Candidatus Pacearchaeota archaeon]
MAEIIGKGVNFDDVLIIPKYNKVKSREDVSFKTKVTRNHYIDIPFLAANMDTICESKMAIEIGKLGGLGVIHRFMSVEEQANHVKSVKEKGLICAAAIGVKDVEKRAKALVEAGVDIIVIDIAHGHSESAGKTLEYLKKEYPDVDVMAGNIATKDAAKYFLSKGADALKIGIGPGSVCTTRMMTGVGVPQLTAIMNVYESVKEEIPICADGGIKKPADVVKAIGAGASSVMCGYIFAGTEETPGKIKIINGKKFKIYRGSASYDVSLKSKQLELNKEEIKKEVKFVEGKKIMVPYKGPIKPIIEKYLAGLASGMTYVGAKEMKDIIGKVDFILKYKV